MRILPAICVASLLIFVTPAAQAQSQPVTSEAVVLDVIDGDTIRVRVDDREEVVRYIGYDAPEMGRRPQCFAIESTEANRSLVAGETVTLIKDRSERDRNKRLLRHVQLADGTLVTELLTEEGNGFARRFAPDLAQQRALAAAQTRAIDSKAGLWKACDVNRARTRTSFRPAPKPERVAPAAPANNLVGAQDAAQPAAPAANTRAGCDPSYPTICIPAGSADLDCGDIPHRRFEVIGSDPHRFDRDKDGIGCES